MTVFIASLFLPHTINFKVEQNKSSPVFLGSIPRNPSQILIGNYGTNGNSSGTFTPPAAVNNSAVPDTPAMTPPLSTEDSDPFASKVPPKGLSLQLPKPLIEFQLNAPGEPYSPRWGRTQYFNQPKSRAEELPPSSILMGPSPIQRTGRAIASIVTDTRDSSHERAIQSAEWSVEPSEQGNSGLRSAVHAICHSDKTVEKTWVGTLGMPTDALDEERKHDIEYKLQDEYDSLVVWPADSDFDGHYSHYSKVMLWPVLHYQIPDNPKSKAYQDHSWIYYVKVNQAFADKIVKSYKKGDKIWVHDYHLMLLPAMIRQKLPDAEIGFYLHVAFPSSEVFRCLAMRKELLEGVLGANLIGFQTAEYCMHFLQTCNRLLCVEAMTNGVQLEDRFVNVATFPMGVDLETLDARRKDPTVQEVVRHMQHKYAGKHLIVARDKLDHVRGVRQKLQAYELFLDQYPQYRETVVMIQVATSTTEQAELDAAVDGLVTRINSRYSSLSHQPLIFLKQDMAYSQYLAMLTAADALMITSLREGMNLTSHEFLRCQDGALGSKKHGSLILSEFTGSSSFFNGEELSVNPWDYRQCAEAIRKSIEMSNEEKTERWEKLIASVKKCSGSHWFNSFLGQLHEAWERHARNHTLSIPRLSFSDLSKQYKDAGCRLFMLDYEGTLVSRESPRTMMFNSPQRTIDALTNLIADPKNIVYIMSGKGPEELDMLFQRVPGLGMIAENGCFIKEFDSDTWHELADLEAIAEWKESIKSVLTYYQNRIDGSYIEERYCSIIFHYRDAKDLQAAGRHGGDCTNHINEACQNLHVQAVPFKGGLVIEPTDWSKSTAAARIFEGVRERGERSSPDFLMVAGDSREDEGIYRWANKLGAEKTVRDVTTVSVSSRNTEAMATLSQGVTGVVSTLFKLAALE